MNHRSNQLMGIVAVAQPVGNFLRVAVLLEFADDLAGLVGGQVGEHLLIDQGRRTLVAHPDARGILQRNLAVRGRLSESDAQFLGKGLGHRIGAVHPIHHIVAQPDDHLTLGRAGQEGVERRGAFDLHPLAVHLGGDQVEGLRGHAPQPVLHLRNYVHHPRPVLIDRAADLLDHGLGFAHESPFPKSDSSCDFKQSAGPFIPAPGSPSRPPPAAE